MPSAYDLKEVTATSQGYAGGVNIRDALARLAGNEARKMENGTLDERGAFDKRLGCESHGTFGVGTDRALSVYTYYRAGSTPQVIMHTTGGKLYYTNDPSANPITWTLIVSGVSTTQPFSFETFNGKCYMSNGVDSYASWDGATYTTFPTTPKGKFLRLWKDTMFMGGVPSLPDRVYESAAGNAESWPVAGWIDLLKGDGDELTALGSDGLYLIVFKRNRHLVIYDPVTLANRVIDFEKGCESHFSVVQFESEIYFLSRRGICKYLGNSPSEIISGKLDPLFDPRVLNLDALNLSCAYTYDNRIGWSLPEVNQSIPSLQIEYYPRLGDITAFGNRSVGPFVFHRMPAAVFTRVRSGATEYLYGAHNTSNKFLYLFAPVGTDDGQTFTAILESGAIDFGSPSRTKYIRRVRLLVRGDFTFQLKRNFDAAVYKTFPVAASATQDTWNVAETWDIAGTWGPDSVYKEFVVNPDAYGRYFQLVFQDSSDQTSRKIINVGSKEYGIDAGGWGLYLFTADADLLGVRD